MLFSVVFEALDLFSNLEGTNLVHCNAAKSSDESKTSVVAVEFFGPKNRHWEEIRGGLFVGFILYTSSVHDL